MRFNARLVRLEARQPTVEEDDRMPRVAGVPIQIARIEYVKWLRRHLANAGRTEESRLSIQQIIDNVMKVVRLAREAIDANDGKLQV